MRKRPRPDRIAAILREIQVDLQAGLNINQACRTGGIGLTTYYRWEALQENPVSNEKLRISELEDEVGRLKQLVAELAPDRRMLQETLKKMPGPPRVAARSSPSRVTSSTSRRAAPVAPWDWIAPACATSPGIATRPSRWRGGSNS
jgi:putative transposase